MAAKAMAKIESGSNGVGGVKWRKLKS